MSILGANDNSYYVFDKHEVVKIWAWSVYKIELYICVCVWIMGIMFSTMWSYFRDILFENASILLLHSSDIYSLKEQNLMFIWVS